MKLHFLNLVLFAIGSLLGSCNSETRMVLLKKDKIQGIETIKYTSSEKFGNYIIAATKNENTNFDYSIYVTSDGRLLHVIKYENYNEEEKEDEICRRMQLLVTDTSQKSDPTFFENPVNGYYSVSIHNAVIEKLNPQTQVLPLSSEEKRLFTIIDSLTKSKNIKYNGFDTSKVLGWFKYVF